MSHAGVDHVRGIDAVLVRLGNSYDFQIDDSGDFLTADAFDTAILVSLFCDRRAEASEVAEESLRRGWIGNTPDFEIGSKLWLFYQNRLTRTTRNGIVSAAQEALQWMVNDSIPASGTTVADSVSATATLEAGGTIRLNITIERPSSRTAKRYYDLWSATGQSL